MTMNTAENLGNLPLRAKAICSPFFTWDLSLWRCKSRFFFHVWRIKLFIGAWLCGCRHFCRFFLKGNQLLPNRISASEHFHYFLGPWILRKKIDKDGKMISKSICPVMFQILSVFIKTIHELQRMGPHMLTQGSCAWEGLVNQLPKSPMTHSLRVKQWYTSMTHHFFTLRYLAPCT